MTDLEGATGVAGTWEDINPGGREHLSSKKYLTSDVNAAIEGAIKGGVKEIVVLDGHGAAFSIVLEDLHPKAQLIRGRRVLELQGLDKTFDTMFAIGAHSMAGTTRGLLTHTFRPIQILNIWLNNQLIGEIGIWAAIAGHYDVPIALVTGDLAAVKEAESLLSGVETVAVKEATSRFSAKCLHPSITHKLISEASKRAILKAKELVPYKPQRPMELKVEFQDSDAAERVAKRPGVKRIDGRTVLGCGENILELLALIEG